MFGYIFLGPLIAGWFTPWHLGVVFATKIFFLDGYVLDFSTYLFAGGFLLCALLIQDLAINLENHPKNRKILLRSLIWNYILLGLLIGFAAFHFGALTILISPPVYIFGLVPIYFWRSTFHPGKLLK